MKIEDVENLAALARISLSGEEKEELLKDMAGILDYVKVIESVEVEDESLVYEHKNAWREDAADAEKYSKDGIVGQFPDSKDGFLKVKKIL